VCVLDIEASLEHFAQNKAIDADTILVVVEPYYRSLETGRRMARLARQLRPKHLAIVANKVRDQVELEAVEELAATEGLEAIGVVPFDERFPEAERAGSAPIDFDPQAPAVTAIDDLAQRLLAAER
jgi:CO dehydrogenase maturation factor